MRWPLARNGALTLGAEGRGVHGDSGEVGKDPEDRTEKRYELCNRMKKKRAEAEMSLSRSVGRVVFASDYSTAHININILSSS